MTSDDEPTLFRPDEAPVEITRALPFFTTLILARAWKLAPKTLDFHWTALWTRALSSIGSLEINASPLAISCPWRGPNPTAALRQQDPSNLSESSAACALGIILAPAIGPVPQWRGALLTATSMLLPHIENAPQAWLVQKRLAKMCDELPRDGRPIAAHDPVAMLSSDLGAALLSAANPANFLSFFEGQLGQSFWQPAPITGFGRIFFASFAERIAARLAAEFLLPSQHAKSRAQHAANAVIAWKWLEKNGQISVEACADSLVDAATLVDWAWRSNERSCAPRAWRMACEAFMDEPRIDTFRARLAACGAVSAAKALGPLPEHTLRMELASAMDDSSQRAPAEPKPPKARRL